MGKVQNLENVILGFSKAFKVNNEAYLNIVGDGSHLETLKKIVADNEIKNVIFYGRQPLEKMRAYFEASDVLIISLIDDEIFRITIPSKFQAYLSANKPIMGVIDGEVKDMILKYGIGKVAEPNNIDSIAAVFEEFIKEGIEGDKNFGNKAKELNDSLFNREKNISKLTSFFRKDLPTE